MGKIFTITEGLENMGALRTGGQGSVYKGRRSGHIITAVKLLPTPIHAEDEQDKNFRDFQSEVDKLKKVNEEPNPNVVKILNSGITESGSLPFIEMEFIEGSDLEELLKSPHDSLFTIREAIKVADQLSNALAHCHKVSVKHGDIKSNNVKLNVHSGNYMLLDFGLAIMSDEQRRTSLRHAGAIEFMAPEQNEGKMLFQTDVYSFGVVLFELLAGTVPFPLHDNGETSRNNVMISHMESPVPDLAELRKTNLPAAWSAEKKEREAQIPQWLISVVYKCLSKKPEDRFANGMELHESIVNGSITPMIGQASNGKDLSLLQKENDRLKQLILQYQESTNSADDGSANAGNSSFYSLSNDGEANGKTLQLTRSLSTMKPIYLGIIVLGLILSGYVGATVFRAEDNAAKPGKNMALIDTVQIRNQTKKLQDFIIALNSKRINDSIAAAKIVADAKKAAEASARLANESGNGKKKGKGKKFLGISF